MQKSNFPINNETHDYLVGKVISNGAWFPLCREGQVFSRNDWLVELTKQKRVIHLGCADHINLINEKRRSGTYLHDLLSQSCSLLIGIDTNSDALGEMRSLGISNLFELNQFRLEDEFDYLLVPDVIEHVPDVSKFLESLKKYNVSKFVFTTPNAYRLRNRTQFSAELINTDHRYWFSPYTLAKTLYENGFVIDQLNLTDGVSWKRPVQAFLKTYFPLCRDGLAVVARVRNEI